LTKNGRYCIPDQYLSSYVGQQVIRSVLAGSEVSTLFLCHPG